jgi:Protein of unknown function (DUF4054)
MSLINTTLPPTVAEFRKMFPEFSEVSDEMIQLRLEEGMGWVDRFWYPLDAKFAVMYASAHYLSLHDKASGGEISSGSDESGGGGGGGVVDPEIGKVWIKSVRFRDRMVSYERVGASETKESGSGSEAAASAEFWESTPYGQMYLTYRRRNVPHVAVI